MAFGRFVTATLSFLLLLAAAALLVVAADPDWIDRAQEWFG